MKTQGRYTILMGSTNTTHLSLQVSICHNVCARFRSNVLIITTLPPSASYPKIINPRANKNTSLPNFKNARSRTKRILLNATKRA